MALGLVELTRELIPTIYSNQIKLLYLYFNSSILKIMHCRVYVLIAFCLVLCIMDLDGADRVGNPEYMFRGSKCEWVRGQFGSRGAKRPETQIVL